MRGHGYPADVKLKKLYGNRLPLFIICALAIALIVMVVWHFIGGRWAFVPLVPGLLFLWALGLPIYRGRKAILAEQRRLLDAICIGGDRNAGPYTGP